MSIPPPASVDRMEPTGPALQSELRARGTRRWWARKRLWIPGALFVGLNLLYAGDVLLAGDDVPRNTTVGGVPIGGLSQDEAAALLEAELTTAVSAPRDVIAGGITTKLNAGAAGVVLDLERSIEQAGQQPLNPLTRLLSLFTKRESTPVLSVDRDLLDAAIAELAGTIDRAAVDGAITLDGITPVAVEPVPGLELDRTGAATAFADAVRADPLGRANRPVMLPAEEIPVTTTAQDVQAALDAIAGPALAAPILAVAASGVAVEIPVPAIAASLRFTPAPDGHLAASIDPDALQMAMGEAFAPFNTAPQDARFELVNGAMSVVPSVDGSGIDLVPLSQAVLAVLPQPAPRQVEIPLVPAPATFTTEAANALGITQVVSSFTTNYESSSSGENIRVVAAEVDGAVVAPGETFSLNGYTGPRTEAQGYVPAGAIIDGAIEQVVGGGVSQFATTTFNAVFFAGLEDVFHKPHSYYISRYPAGREATVFYDSIDLVFRNDQQTGIYIQTIWAPGSLTVTFWGAKQVDIESLSSERYNFRDPVTQQKPDDGSCSPSGGSTGFDITVTRVFHQLGSGTVLRSEDFVTRYQAPPIIVCVPVPPPAAPTGLVSPDVAPGLRTHAGARVRERTLKGLSP